MCWHQNQIKGCLLGSSRSKKCESTKQRIFSKDKEFFRTIPVLPFYHHRRRRRRRHRRRRCRCLFCFVCKKSCPARVRIPFCIIPVHDVMAQPLNNKNSNQMNDSVELKRLGVEV